MTGIIGILYPPPEVSAEGEHLNYWRLECQKASTDFPYLQGYTIRVSKCSEMEKYAGKRVELRGTYLGKKGVTIKQHYFETKYIGFPPANW